MSLTDLMPSTKDKLIAGLQARLTEVTTLLARGVHERDQDEARPGTPLWDARVFLGRDGKTGAHDIRSDVPGLGPEPVVLDVDPGVQTNQAKGGSSENAAGLIDLINQYGKAAYDFGQGDEGASDEMTDLWNRINRLVRRG